MIGLLMAFDAVAIRAYGWHVDTGPLASFAAIMALATLVILACRYWRRNDELYLFGHAINQMVCLGTTLGFLSYIAAGYNYPLQDAALLKADKWLGFDWYAYLSWANNHPYIAAFLSFSYQSFGLQIILFICLLFIRKHTAHAQRFMIIFYVSGLICITLSAFFPAVGIYIHDNIQPQQFAYLHPAAARVHESVLMALRGHSLTNLTFPLRGLITFPSFHTSIALLLIYASLPFRRLRWIMIPLNIAMVFSTPIDGGHYLVDVLAGMVITSMAMYIAQRALPTKP